MAKKKRLAAKNNIWESPRVKLALLKDGLRDSVKGTLEAVCKEKGVLDVPVSCAKNYIRGAKIESRKYMTLKLDYLALKKKTESAEKNFFKVRDSVFSEEFTEEDKKKYDRLSKKLMETKAGEIEKEKSSDYYDRKMRYLL